MSNHFLVEGLEEIEKLGVGNLGAPSQFQCFLNLLALTLVPGLYCIIHLLNITFKQVVDLLESLCLTSFRVVLGNYLHILVLLGGEQVVVSVAADFYREIRISTVSDLVTVVFSLVLKDTLSGVKWGLSGNRYWSPNVIDPPAGSFLSES